MNTITTSLVLVFTMISKERRRCRQLLVSSSLSILIPAYLLVVLSTSFLQSANASSTEREVGVAAASTTRSIGIPPVTPERLLEPGVRIVLDERVKTDLSGRLQVLFLDGTALTLGADSDVVIDKFFYDPNSGEGNLVVSATSGLFRVIGGKISKKNAIKFNTPTAKITIRGGMGDIRIDKQGVSAYFYYGTSMSVTSNGVSKVISRSGYTITTTSGGIPSEPKPAKQEDLEALSEQLKVVSSEDESDDTAVETVETVKKSKKKAAKKKAAKKKPTEPADSETAASEDTEEESEIAIGEEK